MRFFLSILLIAVLSAVAEYFLPWWTLAIIAFGVAAFMRMKGWRSFLAGFLAIGLFWLVAFLIRDIPNEHILSMRMSRVFGLKDYGLFIAIACVLGALIGGLSSLGGALVMNSRNRSKVISKKEITVRN